MNVRTHTSIIVHACGSCKIIKTLIIRYTGTVEGIGVYILEQPTVSVRAVPEL